MKSWKYLIFLVCTVSVCFCNDFGYISYSTTNIGDDIQALAVKRFIPDNSLPIDREYVSEFTHDSEVKTVINGWFMHTKDIYWYRGDKAAPEVSWPPAPCIKPFFISIYFVKPFLPVALSDEGVAYLMEHAPIGARDLNTLAELQSKGIPSYFSGCLTLTLENPYKDNQRKKIIYAVDVDPDVVAYIQSQTTHKVIPFTHAVPLDIMHDNDARLAYAEQVLEMYRKAKCVVTARLHATLPCLAIRTPVLFVGDQPQNGRLHGLKELARHCSQEELLSGQVDFDFNRPPENPQDYLPIREQLIDIMTDWVQNN